MVARLLNMDAMDKARKADDAWRAALIEAARLRDLREAAVRAAHAAGYRPGRIAQALGVSPGRVTQMVGARDAASRQRRG